MQATNAAVPNVRCVQSASALPDVLARVALEIEGAANTLGGFQDILSLTLTELHDHVPSGQLQSLDLLHQTLHELGGVLAALASMSTSNDPFDTAVVLGRCKLSDLAIRLSGGTNAQAPSDVEFF